MGKKTKILAIDLGTFCDNNLMINAISELHKTFDVIYLTDADNKLAAAVGRFHEIIHFKTPSFFINDPELKIADTNHNIMLWVLKHPADAYMAFDWRTSMVSKIHEILALYDIQKIIILYPAMFLLWQIENDIFKKYPTYILYYAPGFVNKKIPWLFDSVLRSQNFKLYANFARENIQSGMKYIERGITSGVGGGTSIAKKLRLLHHVFAWDQKITAGIKPYHSGLKVHKIGSILLKNETRKIPSDVMDIVKRKKKLIFMSFGSYGNSAELKKKVMHLIGELENYCKGEDDAHVIYHNGDYNSPYITSIRGYIPYTKIIPKCKLVVFTGSACLANVCFYNQVPMHFLPLLTEQYFWARNYQHFTGCGFDTPIQFEPSKKTLKYLERVSKSMRRHDAARGLLRLLSL